MNDFSKREAGMKIGPGVLFWQWPREGMIWFAWAWNPYYSRWKIWRVGPINYHIARRPA